MNGVTLLPFTEADLLRTIPYRFQQVLSSLSPDQPAYVSEEETLTYGSLAVTSQGLAAILGEQLGCATVPTAQQAVALLLPQQAATLGAIMGVLQAGHFYLPLDPVMGEATLRQILADCPPQAIVTTAALQAQLAAVLPPDHKPLVLLSEAITPAVPPFVLAQPADSALYASILYTSGSTGQPRGVIRTHAANLHSSYLACHDLGFTENDRVSYLLSYAHSFSNPTIFGGLLNGATLYAPGTGTMTPLALYQWLVENRITDLSTSVGVLRGLAALAATHPPLTALRTISTGGEVIQRAEVEQLCRLLSPTCKLVVRLASTEAGTYARFMINAGQSWHGDQTPGGYVPPGQQVLIVDEQQQPVAVGEPGEIAVRSRFLCAGYWQRPDETAAKFLPVPADSTQKIFLTGDMGRMSADGLVEHLGRKDFMVKIRGYRVQLEEVETALNALPAINEATVVARATSTGEKQLIAYYTAVSTALPTADALRTALLTTLPAYMVPARFVRLDTLPRTAIGKVNRAALPPPGTARPALGTPFVAPRNDLEEQIADLWAELLDVDAVGIDDNFFELGGDSLNLLRMSALLTQRFGHAIPHHYYATPTMRYLVECLDGAAPTLADNAPLAPKSTQPPQQFQGLYPTTWLGKTIFTRGPSLRGRWLPYSTGTALQRTVLQQPFMRNRVFKKQQVLLTQVFRDAGIVTPDDHLTLNLMANTWQGWRKQALQSPVTFARWVSIQGEEALRAGIDTGRGVIIVFLHQNFGGTLTRRWLLARTGVQEVLGITGWQPDDTDITGLSNQIRRTQSASAGLALLQRGQAILIAGDGRATRNSLPVPFYGRQLPLSRGIAMLAQLSQAAVVAVFAAMDSAGHITLEFAPLATPTTTGDADDLLYQYADLLIARWPKVLTTMKWVRLQHLIDSPIIPGP